jgi:hypothetical protein
LCSVHDTIEFEKRGIPATVIITQAFHNAALFQFKSKGMEGHAYVEMPHPVSNLSADDMRALTLQYTAEVARQLRE